MMEEHQIKKKCRQYSVDYLKYGFIASPNNIQQPMCLLCEKSFSNEAMKPLRLLDHIKRNHPSHVEKNISYFQSLRDKVQNRKTIPNMFNMSQQNDDAGLRSSYNISLMIAKSGKPHTIGEELILPAIEEVLSTVIKHKSPIQIIKSIPLSNNTVQRRIDEMAENVQETLCNILKIQPFSLQLDESTLPGNEALLLGYVRFIREDTVVQELLFAKEMNTYTKGESLFGVVEQFFKEREIPMTNIIACATDGAPSMVGRHKGFIAYLKKAVPNVFVIHCVIHRQHLVAKNLSDRLHKSLSIVITSVNKIKTNALNSRLFRELCTQNDEHFKLLLLHTEVRWLSKGNCLKRFYALFNTVIEFLKEMKYCSLVEELETCKTDIAYLTDLFTKFNEINLQLQGSDVNLIKAKSVIASFMEKLQTFKRNIGRRELVQFPNLAQMDEDETISDDDLQVYCDHIDQLKTDMNVRFQDLLTMEIPDWIINPFSDICMNDLEINVEEQLISLKNDFELKPLFKKSYQEFWLQKEIPVRYPMLWNEVQLFFIAFPTSYLVERGFSAVTRLISKQRNRLQITKRGDLRLLLTEMTPDISSLMMKHQIHKSH